MNSIRIIIFLFALSLVSCKNAPAGEKAKTKEAAKTVAATTGKSYHVNTTDSKVMWTGMKIARQHTGAIDVKSGSLAVSEGKVTGGKFTLDIASLICTDLEAGKGKEKLEGHLKSADFFDADQFPTSTFEITKVTSLTDATDANHLVYGNLTLKDVTKEIGFKAKVDITEGGVSISTPDFTINRADFNIKYGSGRFFDDLGDKAINDEVGIKIQLKAS